MGILDSLKQTAAEALKKAAANTVNTAAATTKAAAASSSKVAEAAVAKAATLVGSKVTDAMINTLANSLPNTASPSNPAASAKAASLVGSKVAQNEQPPAEPIKLSPAEVEANIEARVRAKGGSSNWRYSVVDLMSALDMNSSLGARAAVASRLNYSGYSADGSAEKNNWLHAELLRILALNGGEVPWELKEAASAGAKAAPNVQASAAQNKPSYPEAEAAVEAKAKAKNMQHANWRYSIVDLMAVLGMDSSLTSRKALAAKLNYSGYDADGSAEKNTWLHSELLKALAQNGGEVPSYLL